MTSGPSAVAPIDRAPPGTLMKLPEGVLAFAPVLNAISSEAPLSVAPIAPTTRMVAPSATTANTAISLDFASIEGLLVRGAAIVPA
jgi:hypothetical protein